tara:strand:+ start:15152 stop:15724 length:573 start_codon:yes stop_codon:yes gene_type:complete
MDVFVHEDKVGFRRRLFGVITLSMALIITLLLVDYFHCTFGVVNESCGQTYPGMENQNKSLIDTPLPIGIFFIFVLTVVGGFFGFFHGKQVVSRGHLMVERYIFWIRFSRASLANLTDYNEVRVTSQKGFGKMTYHLIRTPERDVFLIELVGIKGKRIVAYLQDAVIAKAYTDNLVKATGFPLKEVLVPN